MNPEKKMVTKKIFSQAFEIMCTARAMSDIYEKNKEITSKYVHATSKGHEAIQIALDCNYIRMIGLPPTIEMMRYCLVWE